MIIMMINSLSKVGVPTSSKLIDNDNNGYDKGNFIAPYFLRSLRRITYFTTKR